MKKYNGKNQNHLGTSKAKDKGSQSALKTKQKGPSRYFQIISKHYLQKVPEIPLNCFRNNTQKYSRDYFKLLQKQNTSSPRNPLKLPQKQSTKDPRDSFKLLQNRNKREILSNYFKNKTKSALEILSNYFKNKTCKGCRDFFQKQTQGVPNILSN